MQRLTRYRPKHPAQMKRGHPELRCQHADLRRARQIARQLRPRSVRQLHIRSPDPAHVRRAPPPRPSRQYRRNNRDRLLLCPQRIVRRTRQPQHQTTLPNVERCVDRRVLPPEQPPRPAPTSLALTPLHDRHRQRLRHRKPLAPVALRTRHRTRVLLPTVVDRRQPRIRQKRSRPRLADPHRRPREYHQIMVDRSAVPEQRIVRPAPEHANLDAAQPRYPLVDHPALASRRLSGHVARQPPPARSRSRSR